MGNLDNQGQEHHPRHCTSALFARDQAELQDYSDPHGRYQHAWFIYLIPRSILTPALGFHGLRQPRRLILAGSDKIRTHQFGNWLSHVLGESPLDLRCGLQDVCHDTMGHRPLEDHHRCYAHYWVFNAAQSW